MGLDNTGASERTMTDDLFPPTLDDLIACIERELAMRRAVYPKRIAAGVLSQAAADRQMALMAAVLANLQAQRAID